MTSDTDFDTISLDTTHAVLDRKDRKAAQFNDDYVHKCVWKEKTET